MYTYTCILQQKRILAIDLHTYEIDYSNDPVNRRRCAVLDLS